jgi:hypothetical protein
MKLKNLRFSLMALAVILAAGTALAANVKAKAQRNTTFYYRTSVGTYAVAGIKGDDYVCENALVPVCTYTLNSTTGNFVPFEYGKIAFLK